MSRKKSNTKFIYHFFWIKIKKNFIKNYFRYIIGPPPYVPYVGCSSTNCHFLKSKSKLCCLKLNQECVHSKATQISQYNFEKKAIILAAENSNKVIYNFIVPLRSMSLDRSQLHPILLLFENELVVFIIILNQKLH